MTSEEILDRLQDVFNNVFVQPTKVTPGLNAGDVDEWDSLSHISLVVAVEKHFGVKFRVGEVEATKNVGEFASLIAKRLSER